MSGCAEAEDRAASLAELMQIEAVCDRFEAACRADARPDLASFLAELPTSSPARVRLFRGLLTLDLESQLGRGGAPEPEVYIDRFPEFASVIPEIFAAFTQGDAPAPLSADHRERPGAPAASSGPDTQFGEAPPGAELSAVALDALRSAGYEIHGELGRGGMGVVYLARKLALNRPCALKMILAGPHAGSAVAARFRTEAEAVARLRHPGIVQIYHVGEAGGLPFLELEYLSGGNLDRALDGNPRPADDAVRMVEALAVAIAEAHGKGIVHRDLKPANVLLDADGSPKIADFGLAKVLDSDSNLTRTQTVLGSPSYMAPEQAEGRSHLAGAATDVYALGAIFYTLLTGGPPFRAATALETLAQVKSADPVPPSRLQPGLPRDLETICLKCLEKAPARRYARAEDLAEDLRRYRSGESILARPTPAWERAWKWARRRPAVAAAVTVGMIAFGIFLVAAWHYNARLRDALATTRVAEQHAQALATTAVRERNLALKAFDALVNEVQDKLGKGGATRAIRQRLLDTAIAGLGELASDDDSFAPDLGRAVAHLKLGEIYRQVGRVPEARKEFERSIELARKLRVATPHDVAVLECLCRGFGQLGYSILLEDRPHDAQPLLKDAAQIADEIVATAPARVDIRELQIKSYERLGHAHHWIREIDDSRAAYRRAHELTKAWVAGEPQSRQANLQLATSFIKLGDVEDLAGQAAQSRSYFNEAISLCRTRLMADPDESNKLVLQTALNNLARLEVAQHQVARARNLQAESSAILVGIAEADPEDIDKQLRVIVDRYNRIVFERDDGRFAEALELIRPTLAKLLSLKREGKLEAQPRFGKEFVEELTDDLAYCEAAPRALSDLEFARSQSPALASRLLELKARRAAAESDVPGLFAIAKAVSALPFAENEQLSRLAIACATCVRCLDALPSPPAQSAEGESLSRRCAERGIAALDHAIDHGFKNNIFLENDASLEPLRKHPGFRALVERLYHPTGNAGQTAGGRE
jgi:eukaryotic-like serine/threonine-protein kinase